MGNRKSNIIEINGKRYDARSGAPLDGVIETPPAHQKASVSIAEAIPVRHAHHSPGQTTATSHKAVRHKAKSAHSHAPERSKTLMRHTVQKPQATLKRRIKAHHTSDSLAARPAAMIAPKHSAAKIDTQKLSHAGQIPKSQLVQRFSKSQPASVAVPVTVKKSAPPKSAHHQSPKRAAPPAPKHFGSTAELLDHALKQATSHEQAPPKQATRKIRLNRRASLTALSVAVVILAGFLAYSNLANVKLKVASSKAGFDASLPDQAPAGYHLSHLQYSPGVIAIQYHSNSDDRSFAITEKASEWNSGTLRDTYLAASGKDYQAVESGGRTLYLLGKDAATWVSGGIWYQVRSNGALSPRQLVDMASGM